MAQSLSHVMGQYMRLEQRLTPQLIQSMDILQLNNLALENRIAEELEKNCALELADPTAKKTDADANQDPGAEASPAPESEDSFRRLDQLSEEYDLDFNESPYRPRRSFDSRERDAKMDAMANTASRPESLAEHLLGQWHVLDLDHETRRAGDAIVYHLDDDGYLRTRLEEIAENTRPPISVDALRQALPQVQRLDPVGVAARDYQECLLLQLEALPGDNRIEHELIQDHLHDVVKNRFPAIAKATGYSTGEITEAVRAISSTLVLHPAYLVVDGQVLPIHPDVIVEYASSGGGLTVRLTRGSSPGLRVSRRAVEILKNRRNGKGERDFVRKHVDAANALIDAVQYRRGRLLDVAQAIIEKQRDFFEIGPQGLKVLRMCDLAVELSCDPSTISRTVAEKYMQCPRGIYPLRYFFTGGTETSAGENTSWDSVKIRVRDIVDEEDRKQPLNDDRIAAQLKTEGIEISRRTVAKYRQQLDIPPARQRREF
ncbi:MAG: RNA polymerase factor sigma-54 [bacterium]|nr:RNA polymerase factor sigma-54 [bacterium]